MNAASSGNRKQVDLPRVRARMQAYTVKPGSIDEKDGIQSEIVTLSAVYSSDPESENWSYSQATPSANLTMFINNHAAFGFFKEGKQYKLTFEEL